MRIKLTTSIHMKKEPMLELKLAQISHRDLAGNINALGAMAGQDVTDEQWREILVNEQVPGSVELLNHLHDYLLNHSGEIQTAEQLRDLVQQLKQQK
jgi:alkylhydroperoxidase family enzyme